MQEKDESVMIPGISKDVSDSHQHASLINSDEIILLDYLIILAKRKRLIVAGTLGAAIIAAVISLFLTPVYRAETKILPPQQSSSMASQMLSQLGAVAGLAGGALNVKTTNDLYMGFLKSRPILDNVIDKFNLMSLYKTKGREYARNTLIGMLVVQDDKKSGIITVGIEDSNPKMAADIANAFIEELRNFNKGLAVTEASRRRLFFQEQLRDSKDALMKAEESMKGFQEKTGAIKIDEQARVVIEGISQLRAKVAAKEVQVKVMRTYSTSQNPDIQVAEEELKGLKEQLSKMETRDSGRSVMVPTGNMPSLGTEYLRRMRDLKFNETLYELLLKQYEAAKLDEARDATIIQILEKAIPPESRVKPKRRQMVTIATVAGFIFAVFVSFLVEYKERISNEPESKVKLEMLRKYARFR